MIAYLIALGILTGIIAIGLATWSWRAGHSYVMWQNYRMEDPDARQWPTAE